MTHILGLILFAFGLLMFSGGQSPAGVLLATALVGAGAAMLFA